MRRTLELPATTETARELRVGDEVLVRGRLITGREEAVRHLAGHDDPRVRPLAEGSLLYHCGPVVARDPRTGALRFVAAGPSASARAEPWQAEAIARYGLRGVVGMGGMGPRTLAALGRHGAVYLHAIDGLSVTLARCVSAVEGPFGPEGRAAPDAIWAIEVRDFPALVTMDAWGGNLHDRPGVEAERFVRQLLERRAG